MDEIEKEKLIGSYTLWKSNLISNEQFQDILDKISGQSDTEKRYNSGSENFSPNEHPDNLNNYAKITPAQVNCIINLIEQGRIPETQTLDITKKEAQMLIKNALSQQTKPDRVKSDIGRSNGEQSQGNFGQEGQTADAQVNHLLNTEEYPDY